MNRIARDSPQQFAFITRGLVLLHAPNPITSYYHLLIDSLRHTRSKLVLTCTYGQVFAFSQLAPACVESLRRRVLDSQISRFFYDDG